MRNLTFASILLALAPLAMQAEDNHLYIQPNEGETVSWDVPSLQKISFVNGNVTLTKKNGSTAYVPISSVKRMYICPPSANQIDLTDSHLPYIWDGKSLRVNGRKGASVTVYSVTGAVVLRERVSDSAIDFQGLRNGLYLVNVDGNIFKVIKK